MNEEIIKDTNELISRQNNDGVVGNHDTNALNVFGEDSNINWDAENIGVGIQHANIPNNPTPTSATMDQLKNLIYNDIRAFVSQDAGEDWNHAETTIDTDYRKNEGFAIGIDKFGYVHFEFATGFDNDLDSSMIALPSNNKLQLEQQAATLQDKLNQANNDVASK